MEDIEFLFDGRITHRGRLQAIAQGFVIQKNEAGRTQACRVILVPVVDEFRSLHPQSMFGDGSLSCPVELARWLLISP